MCWTLVSYTDSLVWQGGWYGLACYTYEIRWVGVICIQTGLAGALLLSCGEPHCQLYLSFHKMPRRNV